MIGIHPNVRIELARWHRQEQEQAAERSRIEAEARAARPAGPSPRRGRVIPRLRPQQLRP